MQNYVGPIAVRLCLCVCLVCLCFCLCFSVSACLSMFLCVSVSTCLCVILCLWAYPPASLCLCLCPCLSFCACFSACVCLSTRLCLSLSLLLSLSVCVSVHVCLCLCLSPFARNSVSLLLSISLRLPPFFLSRSVSLTLGIYLSVSQCQRLGLLSFRLFRAYIPSSLLYETRVHNYIPTGWKEACFPRMTSSEGLGFYQSKDNQSWYHSFTTWFCEGSKACSSHNHV